MNYTSFLILNPLVIAIGVDAALLALLLIFLLVKLCRNISRGEKIDFPEEPEAEKEESLSAPADAEATEDEQAQPEEQAETEALPEAEAEEPEAPETEETAEIEVAEEVAEEATKTEEEVEIAEEEVEDGEIEVAEAEIAGEDAEEVEEETETVDEDQEEAVEEEIEETDEEEDSDGQDDSDDEEDGDDDNDDEAEEEVVVAAPSEKEIESFVASGGLFIGGLNIISGKRVPFCEKILSAKKKTQENYDEIYNTFISYRKINPTVTKKCAKFRNGRELIAKVTYRGKTMKLHLALDVNEYDYNSYFQKDLSDKKAYAEVPFTIKVRSERGLKNAVVLIDELMSNKGVERKVRFNRVDSIAQLKKLKNK